MTIKKLPVREFRNTYEATGIGCRSTKELVPSGDIIGQERAVRALNFGLNIEEKGFNIYASGIPGTGRKTTVRKFLNEVARKKPNGSDWIYVHNFGNPYEPRAIRLPPGMGKQLRDDMASFVEEARRTIPQVFESEDYATKRQNSIQAIDDEKAKIISQLNTVAQGKGFFIQPGPQGLLIIPVKDGKPLTEEEFLTLPGEEQEGFQKRREELSVEMRNGFRQLRDMDQKGFDAVKQLNEEVSTYAIGHLLAAFRDKYSAIKEVLEHIDAVQKDIIENLPEFLGVQQESPQGAPLVPNQITKELVFRKYQVNVIVDNSSIMGAPVIFEHNPTYQNLFGITEKEVQFGFINTDFTMIRPGSIHKANGGYLAIPVEDLFRYPLSYDALKTALKTGEAAFEEPAEKMGFITTKGLKPGPIPLSIKVVLIGTPAINQILYSQDPDFYELFKVKAEFDTTMERNEKNVRDYGGFICQLCRQYHLKHLDSSAVAKIIEYSSRLSEDQQKLSTRFSLIADVIREASYYATSEQAAFTTGSHIEKAIEERVYRSNLIQEKIQDYITKDIFLIETEGAHVGQVNGLSVISLGDIEFGRPSRVTASIGVGRDGVMDIEREAAMGGPIHTKGVLILSGYLAGKFSRDKPLSLSARLVFEQSYEGVDGDSASSTELYAILSALSGLPINQALAVTGSVNQNGEVQAIGGVNEKIEGFFEVCKAKGLTGHQGVMIPASNVRNLMLKEEIIEAADAGKFTIYPVKTIDEGIEVLTGVAAGTAGADGKYEKGSVNYLVDKRLKEMAETLKNFQVSR
ncbi:MAG TPA: AAA family ATPase [Methanoregulaceae archaeon]|nr:AAA family ATPase [Methanoregulaceae archaeon]